MQKSKLGMSISLLGVLLFLSAFLGAIPFFLVAGYILINEENQWLKSSAIKAVVIYLAFLVIPMIINLIWGSGSLIGLLESFVGIFATFRINVPFIDRLFSFILSAISIVRTFVFLAFAGMAIKQKTIKMGPIDNM